MSMLAHGTTDTSFKLKGGVDAIAQTFSNIPFDSTILPLSKGGEELLVLVNAENNQPEVFLPSGPFIVEEDEETYIFDVAITDIDMEVSADYEVAVRLSVEQGLLSLNSTDGLGFSVGDGFEDELVYFHGSASSVGDALRAIAYRGHNNW